MAHLPTGTVTFLFTDIQRSTRMWEEHTEAMSEALRRHDEIMREVIDRHEGYVFTTAGDAFAAAFQSAGEGVGAALDAQLALESEEWGDTPVHVRMALHTGQAVERDGDYFGPTLNRCARLQSTACGGQVVISLATHKLLPGELPDGLGFRDLGEHRLKDLSRPERVYQLIHPKLKDDFPALKSLNAYSHNLPIQVTSFVGRQAELKEIEGLLGSSRVVTLLGTGGTGKTRIALQAAANLLPEFPAGIRLVELAGLTDPELIVEQTATALEIGQQRGKTIRETLFDQLGDQKMLILMDNCEHLIDAAAAFIQDLATHTQAVTVLTTSREPLRIEGEAVFSVPPLPVPAAGAASKALEEIPSVQLFVERARAVNPNFKLTDEMTGAVVKLCRRLDGLPLALELAAARTRALSPRRIADGLDNLFRILTGSSRTALPHHRTLEAAVDWSYNMLEPSEQLLLQRLSVFAGGFTEAAAEEICADDELDSLDVLDGIIALVDKSLVATSTDDQGEVRYRLLEIIREYARGKLAEGGGTEQLRRRHLDWFGTLAERAVEGSVGPDQARLFRELNAEQDNFRAAMEWAFAENDSEAGCRLAAALSRVWTVVTKHLPEGHIWLQRAVEHEVDDDLRADLLVRLGAVRFLLGDFAGAATVLDEALPLAEHSSDKVGLAKVLHMAGSVARNNADYDTANEHYQRAIDLYRAADDEARLTEGLGALGDLHCMQDHLDPAWQYYSEALALARKVGHRRAETSILDGMSMVAAKKGLLEEAAQMNEQGMTIAEDLGDSLHKALHSHDRAVICRLRGETDAAEKLFAESLSIMKELRAWQSVACLEGLGSVALDRGDRDRAATLFAAAERQRTTVALHKNWRWSYEEDANELKSECTDEACLLSWGRGAMMSLDQAVEFALNSPPG